MGHWLVLPKGQKLGIALTGLRWSHRIPLECEMMRAKNLANGTMWNRKGLGGIFHALRKPVGIS